MYKLSYIEINKLNKLREDKSLLFIMHMFFRILVFIFSSLRF
jgi:hypothetical protein